MIMDFHTHTKLSKKAPFSIRYFRRMVEAARKNGLTSLALTEHFNTVRFDEIYDTLDRHLEYVDPYYELDGFRVFPGMEIDIAENGHVLLIGRTRDIRDIRHHFSARTEKGQFPSFEEWFQVAESYDLLKIGAHPTRRSTPLQHLSPDLLQRLDAFDLNGKDLAKQPGTRETVYEWARKLNKPVVAGSDSHLPVQLGCVKNRLHTDCKSIRELRSCILNREYETVVSASVKWKVHAARIMKKTIKTVRQL